MFNGYTDDEIREIANEKISESEIAFRIGNAFQSMVHYTIKLRDNPNRFKVNNDIVIDFLDRRLVVEVKAPKGYQSESGRGSNGAPWEPYERDFNWLKEEIRLGNRENRAFIIGWLNCVSYLGEILQLGRGGGGKPKMSDTKLQLLPFLIDPHGEGFTKDYAYDYSQTDIELETTCLGDDVALKCLFIGRQSDSLHFAIYY